jgi:ABC-type branched-subunit amino acid transport system ATPase component
MKVLFGVSLCVTPGESVCLLGRNGMGKTTIFRTITGNLPTEAGIIKLQSVDITKKPIFERARLGMRYVPDSKGVFDHLTLRENLQLALMRTPKSSGMAAATELFPELKDRFNQHAGTLSGGEKKMLSVAMVLLAQPKLSILDEVSEGLAPLILERLRSVLSAFKSKESMILLAEQNVKFGCELADRVYVVREGRVVLESRANEFLGSEGMREQIGIS